MAGDHAALGGQAAAGRSWPGSSHPCDHSFILLATRKQSFSGLVSLSQLFRLRENTSSGDSDESEERGHRSIRPAGTAGVHGRGNAMFVCSTPDLRTSNWMAKMMRTCYTPVARARVLFYMVWTEPRTRLP